MKEPPRKSIKINQQTFQNMDTNINSNDEETDGEDSRLSKTNNTVLRKPEILLSTVQYITNDTNSDDEEIDVVNIDDYPKPSNSPIICASSTDKISKIKKKSCCNESSPVSKIENKTVKPVLSLTEGMQKLFSPIHKRFSNSSKSDKILSDIDGLKTIENIMYDRVKNNKNVDVSDNTSNKKNYISVINVIDNNELGKSNKENFFKTMNDEECLKLHNVKVILNRNVVDNYFKSKQLINENTISNSSKIKIFNNNNTLNSTNKINATSKSNNKKTLKQTTMLHFFNTKKVCTDVIENNENSPNKVVDNRETITKKVASRVRKTPVTARPKRLIHAMENSSVDLLFNSLLKVVDTPDLNNSKSPKKLAFLYCNDCDYKTNKGKVRILQHIQSKHINGFINGIVECQQCGQKFKKTSYLKSHQAICGLIPHFKCSFCSLRSKYESNIKKHIQKQHQNKFEPNEFNDIFHKIVSEGKAFKAKALKLALEGKEIPKGEQKVKTTMENKIDMYCIECNEAFIRDYKKKNIMKMCPNCDKALQFQCVKCKKVLKSYESCWSHITSVCQPQEQKILRCNDCTFTAFFKNKLVEHIQRRHTEIDPKDYVKCPNCNKGFKNRAYMRYHKNACGKSKDYQCQFCSYKTKYIYQWNKHMKIHKMHSKDKSTVSNVNISDSTINKSYEINSFSRILESPETNSKIHSNNKYQIVQVVTPNLIHQEELRQKTLNTLNLATYICLKCQAIDSSTTVKVIDCNKCHVQMHYNCKSCNRKYSNWGSFCYHLIKKCATPNNYQCEHCNRQFTIKNNIRRHIFAEHMTEVDSNGYVKCPKCKNKYKGRQNMLKHKARCGQTELNLKCKFCNIKTNYKHNLRKHMLRQHDNLSRKEVEDALNEIVRKANKKKKVANKNKIPKIKSNILSKEIKNNLSLMPTNQNEFHIFSLKMNKKEIMDTMHLIQVKCPGCSKSYTVNKKKKNHNLAYCFYCKANNIFECLQCSKEYTRCSYIRKHIKREHLLDPDHQRLLYECSNCGKRFTFYENLKEHWRLCFKTDNVICDYCGFATKRKSSLVNHIRRKHLGTKIKKDYECVKCAFKFLEKEQLEKHMRSCIGGYKCDECGAKFKTKLKLLNHIQSKKIN